MKLEIKLAVARNPELAIASALAKHLLAPSPRFEDLNQQRHAAAHDGLRCLATLDRPTRLSLPTDAPEPQPTPAGAEPLPAPTPESGEPRYGSHKSEYQPGLQDQAVVEALLQYHQSKIPPNSRQAPVSSFRPANPTRVFRSR